MSDKKKVDDTLSYYNSKAKSLEAYSKLTDRVELLLDEADKAEVEDNRRFTHEEVFANLRRRVNG